MDLNTLETYDAVNLGLWAIPIKPLIIIWLVGFCFLRTRGDVARSAFLNWWRVTLPLQALGAFLIVISDAMDLIIVIQALSDSTNYYYYYYGEDGSQTSIDLFAVQQAEARTSEVGSFVLRLADITGFMCLAELGIAFLFCNTYQRTALQKFLRYGALAWAFLLLVVNTAAFGVWSASTTYLFQHSYMVGDAWNYDDDFDGISYDTMVHNAEKLDAAYISLALVASVALVALASFVISKFPPKQTLFHAALLFLVAAILDLVRHIWNVVVVAAWELPDKQRPQAVLVVDPILDAWAFLVLLILIYAIGLKKRDGLWTTGPMAVKPQSQTAVPYNQPPVVYMPVQQPVYGAPQPAPQPAWQPQQAQPGVYYYPASPPAPGTHMYPPPAAQK